MAEPKEYKISVFYSDRDECYIANIDNWKYLSAHGDTPEEAVRELSDSIALGREVEQIRNKEREGNGS